MKRLILFCILPLLLYACTPSTDPANWDTVTADKLVETIVLPDSSLVTLQRGSTLRYPARFPQNERRVQLEGEAFFEVKSNADQPFTVATTHETISGTEGRFLVKELPVQSNTLVYVDQGNLSLQVDSLEALVVASRQGAVADHQRATLSLAPAANANLFAWQSGILAFKTTPLRTAFRAIQANFGYTFKLENPELAECIVSGTFEKDAPLDTAKQLFAPFGATVKLVGSTLFEVTGGSCVE